MNKSVYSLVLADEIVQEIDRLAYEAGASRSAMVNQILADHVRYTTPEKRENLHAAILGGLEQTIREIVANPAVIAIKGEAAAEKIKLEHSPENYAEALRQIYQKALSAR